MTIETRPHETRPLGIGLIGSSPSAFFLLERLTLRRDFQIVAVCSEECSAFRPFTDQTCTRHDRPRDVIDDHRVDIVYFATVTDSSEIDGAIRAAKHVVLASPLTLPAQQLNLLANAASQHNVLATLDEPACGDHAFLLTKSAIDSRQLGDVRRVRLSIHEQRLPGELFARGILRDLGSRWFTQLLRLVDAMPRRVELRRFSELTTSADTGFMATIDFDDGVSAVIEIQTRSLLGYRSGWMIEGTAGAYRAGRIYSETADGEIIDEPLATPTVSSDRFLDSLALALCGELHSLPSLHDAACVVDLIDRLEQSSS